MKRKIVLLFLLCLSQGSCLWAQQRVRVTNSTPRLTVKGDTVDAHDGRVTQFGDTFYWYGTTYGKGSGYQKTNYFQCYSSKDLTTWKPEGRLLVNEPKGVYYRPHVIYNKKTKMYVLWYNWYPKLWTGRFAVAVSDKPTGPFQIVNQDVKVAHSSKGLGDFSLFVDDDNTAYISYNTIDGHEGSIEKLRKNYLESSLENGGFISTGTEAGAIFKRKGIYYLLTDYTCCFCTQGSGARVYTSSKPTNGYTLLNNINRYPGTASATLNDGFRTGNLYETIKQQKEGGFSPVQLNLEKDYPVSQVNIHVFTGNRSALCGDTVATKIHPDIVVPTFEVLIQTPKGWQAVTPNRKTVTKGAITNVVSLTLTPQLTSSVLIRPLAYPYAELYLTEVDVLAGQAVVSQASQNAQAFVNNLKAGSGRPIIPAQQTHVLELQTDQGTQYVWMGDLWGSASDNTKGHDYQYWSAPLQFSASGLIQPMTWTDAWSVTIKPASN